jgi:SOS-response transcriptional repressor LexA
MSTTLSHILKRLMFEKQVRTTELARRVGLKQPTVHRIVEGTSLRPHLSTLDPIAKYFAVSVDQLRGAEPLPWNLFGESINLGTEEVSVLPILSWEEAMSWDQHLPIARQRHQSVIMHKKISGNAFALTVTDSSMQPQFPAGTQLIINPDKDIQDRGFAVIALHNHPKAIFRQILVDGQQLYIKPLCPDLEHFNIVPLSKEDRVCGTLVQARLDY